MQAFGAVQRCRAAGSVQGDRDVPVRARGPWRALTHRDIWVFSKPDRFSIWSPMGSGLTCRQWKGVEDFLPFCQASQQCRSSTATFCCLFSLFAVSQHLTSAASICLEGGLEKSSPFSAEGCPPRTAPLLHLGTECQ